MTDWLKNLFHIKHKDKDKQLYSNQFNTQTPQQYQINSSNKQTYKNTNSNQQNYNDTNLNNNNNQQPINNNFTKNNNDSDDDSLGYTQNQWDQQTINFQLEDRMLDCLEDQKHVNSYRQSLIFAMALVKKNSKRISNNNKGQISQPENINTLNQQQIPIQEIIGEKYPQSQKSANISNNNQNIERKSNQQSPNKKQQQVFASKQQKQVHNKPKQRKNRFSKYKKNQQNINNQDTIIQKPWFTHFSPQLQEKINKVFKQKAHQIKNLSLNNKNNESDDDYIARILNMKLTSDKKQVQTNKQQANTQKSKSKQPELFTNQLVKQSSDFSQPSFIVVQQQQINQRSIISFGSIQSEIHSSQQVIKFNQDNLNEENKLNQYKINTNQKQKQKANDKDYDNKLEEQRSKQNVNQNFPQKKFHVLTPPRKHAQVLNNEQILTNKFDDQSSIQSNQHLKGNFYIFKKYAANVQPLYQLEAQSSKNIYSPIKSMEAPESINKSDFALKLEKVKPVFPVKINFISSQQRKQTYVINSQQAPKSPRAKVMFNYGPQQEQQLKKYNSAQINLEPTKIIFKSPILFSPQKKQVKNTVRIHYIQPQPEDRIPIFLRRLRRLNSAYPNLYLPNINQQKINFDLITILNSMRSAICVIQLLYKKLIIQKNKIQQPLIKIQRIKNLSDKIQIEEKQQLQNQIYDLFINSQWQNYKIEEIEYIRPKQRFQKRLLNPIKLDEAIRTYNEFITHYLNEPTPTLKTQGEIKRYIRIRQKISTIVQYLRLISEDLYTFWLIECNYPELYYDYLTFLKKNQNDLKNSPLIDQIYAKLILAEEYKDPISLSIIGEKIMEKIINLFK